jgi:hypothetical protein
MIQDEKQNSLPDDQITDNQQTGEDIVEGANNEDQLDQFNQSVTAEELEGYPDNQTGTPPSTGDEHLDTSKDTGLSNKYKNETQKGYSEKSAGDVGETMPTMGNQLHQNR